MIKEKIKQNLDQILNQLKINNIKYNLAPPVDLQFGSYTTNLALKLTQALAKNPLTIAQMIKDQYPKDKNIAKIEIAPPGFLNFYLTPACLFTEIQAINQWQKYIVPEKKKILLEFGQPNTHKLPHIGHLFSYILGEALARILTQAGNQIMRLNYQGDVGLHVAKCLYAVQKSAKNLKQLTTLEEKINFLQQCYQIGSECYEKDPQAQIAIQLINKKIYEQQKDILPLWQTTRAWSLDYYKFFEKKLGITYDRHYLESETSSEGLTIIKRNTPGIFQQSAGAIIFPGEDYGLHTRVFINQQGNPTYEAKDIGLITLKIKDFAPFDLSLVTTANEQNQYWKVIIMVSELLFPNLKGKLKHLGFGMVNLTTGKMASRTGSIISAFSLLEKVKQEIIKNYKTTDALAEKIAIAAIKYSFLKNEAKKNITFDIKTSIAKEGDSGPYLLYTYARITSLLTKIPDFQPQIEIDKPQSLTLSETELIKRIIQFPEVFANTVKLLAPHLIINYLYKLAREYNNFYQQVPILKAKENKTLKLLITFLTRKIIADGLYLLGIETVDKM